MFSEVQEKTIDSNEFGSKESECMQKERARNRRSGRVEQSQFRVRLGI